MRTRHLSPFAAAALLLVGCTDDPQPRDEPVDTLNEGTVDPNPTIDADPTPQTGNGGSIPLNDPDGTVNSAPAGEAPAPQPPPPPAP